MIFLKLGLRNLLRNKKRSLLSALAIGLGLMAMILMDGFWKGMMNNMKSTVTDTFIGHIQIHNPQFLDSNESEYELKIDDEEVAKIRSDQHVKAVSKRSMFIGMTSSTDESVNVQIVGIDPQEESKISIFDDRIVNGIYVTDENDIVIGERLRKKLNILVGDRIVLTLSHPITGELRQELFRLTGVFLTGSKELDNGVVLIHLNKIRKIIGKEMIHEVAIVLDDEKYTALEAKKLKNKEWKVSTWQELVPQVVATFEMSSTSMAIMGGVFALLVGLGILNTIFMNLFERSFEFGVLAAIGTKKMELLKMILSEALFLSLSSIGVGMALSVLIGTLMSLYGIDYSGIEFGEVTFTDKIYFVFNWTQFTIFPLFTLIFTLLTASIPAIKVMRTKAVDALHRSL